MLLRAVVEFNAIVVGLGQYLHNQYLLPVVEQRDIVSSKRQTCARRQDYRQDYFFVVSHGRVGWIIRKLSHIFAPEEFFAQGVGEAVAYALHYIGHAA